MIWLVTQILGWIFLGALAGGLIGWALHCRKCAHETEGLRKSLEKAYANNYVEPEELKVSGGIGHIPPNAKSYVSVADERYTDLLTQLSAEKEEVAGLKARLSLVGATGKQSFSHNYTGMTAFSGSQDIADKDGEIKWRNRYLESRVRFLESKVSDLEITASNSVLDLEDANAKPVPSVSDLLMDVEDLPLDVLAEESLTSNVNSVSDAPTSIASAEGLKRSEIFANKDLSANHTLLNGVSSSEESEAIAEYKSGLSVQEHEKVAKHSEELSLVEVQSLIWRNRYLEGRVQYLEEDKNAVQDDNSSSMLTNDMENIDPISPFIESLDGESEVVSNNLEIHNDEDIERLRWRTRYLEGRIRFLEEEAADAALAFEKSKIHESLQHFDPILEKERTKKERVDWRNQYLEEKLEILSAAQVSESSEKPSAAIPIKETEGFALKHRAKWREMYLEERISYAQEKLAEEKLKQPKVRELVTDLGMDRLRWRSSYLETRLENSSKNSQPSKDVSDTKVERIETIVEKTVVKSDVKDLTELAKLRWRERYLKALLERQVDNPVQSDEIQVSDAPANEFEEAYLKEIEAELKRLEWRNRFLGGRVKYLEENLSHSNAELETVRSNASSKQVEDVYGDESDTARLKWRNSYLMGRIGYLEDNTSSEPQSFVKSVQTDKKPGDELDNLEALSELKQNRSERLSQDSSTQKESDAEKQNKNFSEFSASYKNESSNSRKAKSRTGTGKNDAPQLTAEAFQTSFKSSEYFVEGDQTTGRPAYLTKPLLGEVDDLREIAGVGPKIERILHDLGIYHFYQIAAWTRREVEWVDNYLTFKGRIDRENWIEQCKMLARGEATDGQRKYRAGKHI
ncbi:hypothetical protein [Hirschia baltica]|uniref:NADH dehydrogenase subunit E n=1 Tax=Hirschia baltica (strain ATCC 49814 / DSM 5838 / IFAM 1418) TaxID=582402 RepID=C6XJZ4_HIRBI|nr:hypothetical protein [Hirschia baltica]ACT59439.1 conserved hypothetical protein [Hirschia baltica ATCC 49814]